MKNCKGLPGTNLVLLAVICILQNFTSGEPITKAGEEDRAQRQSIISFYGNKITFNISSSCGYEPVDFQRMLDSLESSLHFYDRNVGKLSVFDAATGNLVLTAQIRTILQNHIYLPPLFLQHLKHLQKKSVFLVNQIIRTASHDPEYSLVRKEQASSFVTTKGLWDWPRSENEEINSSVWKSLSAISAYYQPNKALNISQILKRNSKTLKKTFDTESDTCLYQTLKCGARKITEACEKLFLREQHSLYILTHQVLYTLFAKKNQCFPGNESILNQFQEKLCGKVWLEANAISQNRFPPRLADLFVEQVAFCAMVGYPNFLRRDWLHQILNWQYPSGCFVDALRQSLRESQPFMESPEYESFHQNEKPNLHKFGNRFGKRHPHKGHRRQKRADTIIRGGDNQEEICSAHFTSLGIMSAGLHLRYFVDTCLTDSVSGKIMSITNK